MSKSANLMNIARDQYISHPFGSKCRVRKEWTMERKVTTARAVAAKVSSEQDHGLLARERLQPRKPAISSVGGASGARGILGRPSRSPAADFQPLQAGGVGNGILSTFRRSSVSECRFTSNLADVKLLLLSFWWLGVGGAPSAEMVSVDSSSSEEDLLRIELGDELHPERGEKREDITGNREDV